MKKFPALLAAATAALVAAVVAAATAGTSALTQTGSPTASNQTSQAASSYQKKKPKPTPKPTKPPKPKPPKPYPGSVPTKCYYNVPSTAKKKKTVKASFSVRAQGNARPSGVVNVYVYKINPKTKRFEHVRTIKKSYTGPNTYTVSLGSFSKTGTYATKVTFYPAKGSVYRMSTSPYQYFKVK